MVSVLKLETNLLTMNLSLSADNNGDSTASPIKREIRTPSFAMLFHRLLTKEPIIAILQQSAKP